MSSEHIVKSYDEELNHLNENILKMGGLAEALLASAIESISQRDPELAAVTVREDRKIDEIEAEIDQQVIRLLALRQPMARDLRNIVGALKMAPDIERVGDYAANVAKRAIPLCDFPPAKSISTVPRMGKIVQHMIKDVLDAFTEGNAEKAKEVWARDEEVDDLYDGMFRELLTYMMEDPRNITPCTHLMFIAKNIERIGDHITNVAETIYYMVEGERLEELRPKGGDSASLFVVTPEDLKKPE
ncbi:MAG: phosphate signaling complex protein PhoU [Rhodospirillales bacterium]|jgi:phosphate transport system protein|nr:phosphate signaling complex protein PhoU [Rhodospirillales bacterium]MBT4005581.1 phosphate signaling complex protein PhoU [Rhodospirillales bacterium]MBT5076791.1 phosphate signaling complex protein PhoU [Rhodospirillales bacterium]MBT5112300.1 phosphate signaling complex protein PhoU [Rhodospirillales bacterium]MBT5672001.1 phosphate signaling complex protein PhoU [Rhodospirillales bacterium]